MNVLGIDGALGGFSAAVARDGRIVAERRLEGHVALEGGLGAIGAVLADSALSPAALDLLAVGIGPGRFTGLRIAIAYAKALAQGWRRPLAGISSFDALEYGRERSRVLTLVEGRPGIVSARLRTPGRTARASGPIAEVLDRVLAGETPESLAVVGASEDVLAALAEAGWVVILSGPLVTPPAAAVALAAVSARISAPAHAVVADYGEAPAARVPIFRPAPRTR